MVSLSSMIIPRFYKRLTNAYTQRPVMSLLELFKDTTPFVLSPRLIISIWNMHASDDCIHVSTTFEDCVCWTSPPKFEQHEMEPSA